MPRGRLFACVLAVTLLSANACSSAVPGRPVPVAAPTTTGIPSEPMDCEYQVLADSYGPMRRIPPPSAEGFRRSGKSTIRFETSLGRVELELDRESAPCSVHSFRHLARNSVYSSGSCHRLTVEQIFVLQCGDPTDTGLGTAGYQFYDPDAVTGGYRRGVVAMSNAGPGTNSSQFFIVYQDSEIEPEYPVIGRITKGMELIDQVVAGGVVPGSGIEPGEGTPAKQIVFLVVEPK